MKLIIDVPKGTYEAVKVGTINQVLEYKVWNAIKDGTPLDDVKAEIKNKYCAEEEPTIYQMGTNLGLRFAVDILDNIGKGDSE